MSKKILGLDLGTNSIGWALIEQDFENKEGKILGMGSRIIPMTQDKKDDFGKGNSISQTADRTKYRSTRRLRERHLLRRERLHRVLNILGFLPEHYAEKIDFEKRLGQFSEETEPKLAWKKNGKKQNGKDKFDFIFQELFEEMITDFKESQPELLNRTNRKGEPAKIPYDWTIYYLRKKALEKAITKEQLAWLILNFNQKRGYYQLRGEEEEDNRNKKEYVIALTINKIEKGDIDKKNDKKSWYKIILSNGWEYSATFANEPQWLNTKKEFLITEEYDDNGQIKIVKNKKSDSTGKEKRHITPLPTFDEIDLMSKKDQDRIYKKIKARTELTISNSKTTVGAYIYDTLLKNPTQKIRGKLVRTIERKFYKDELKQILKKQIKLQPELFTDEIYNDCVCELYRSNEAHQLSLNKRDFVHLLLDDIIFYQRPLKSQKSSIGNCALEYRLHKINKKDDKGNSIKNVFEKDENGKGIEVKEYLKVIPKSNPYYQEFRIWQWLYNLKIYRKDDDKDVTKDFIPEVKDETENQEDALHKRIEILEQLFEFLKAQKEVNHKDILSYFVVPKVQEKFPDAKPKALKEKVADEIAKYRWNYVYDAEKDESKTYPMNETGYEIRRRLLKVGNVPIDFLTREMEQQLWHIIYSVTDKKEFEKALETFAKKHELYYVPKEKRDPKYPDKNCFVENFRNFKPFKSDYGRYSEKEIKKLLPLMRLGNDWSWKMIDEKTKDRISKIITGEYDETIQNRVREKAIFLTQDGHFQGLPEWLAKYVVYDRHSEAIDISKWKMSHEIDIYLDDFKQHSLRNPIVEQVITETLRVVKDIWEYYGKQLNIPFAKVYNEKKKKHVISFENFFDEIHIELGREMKNPADVREKMTRQISDNENTNLRIKAMLMEFSNDDSFKNQRDYKNGEGETPIYFKKGNNPVRPFSPTQQDILKIYEEYVLNDYSEQDLKNEKTGLSETKDGKTKEVTIYDISQKSQPTKSQIEKYKLWLEQKYQSPYTGQMIPLTKLFTPAYEIEHVIPQSRYFDNSFSNKIICESEVNKLKDNQLGLEFIKNHHGEKVPTSSGEVEIFSEAAYTTFVKEHYDKNRGKRNKLLLEEIPDKMIARQLNDTRYISKFITSVLSNIVRADKDDDGINSKNIVPGNGKITSTLKQDWGLNEVWNELILPRFERMNELNKGKRNDLLNELENKKKEFIGNNTISEDEQKKQISGIERKIQALIFTAKNKEGHTIPAIPLEHSKGFQKKRIDHRHHALDALVIACATRDHINLLNNQSAKSDNSRYDLQNKLRNKEKWQDKNGKERDKFTDFKKPWATFTQDAKKEMDTIIVSFKQNLRVINKATNHYDKIENGQKVKVEQKGVNWAIRKSLHTPMPYGKKVYEFDVLTIADNVGKRELIIDDEVKTKVEEAYQNNNCKVTDTQKYLKKNPITDENGDKIIITTFKIKAEKFRKRQPLSELSNRGQGGIKTVEEAIKFINKVADFKIRQDLLNHLNENDNDLEKSFSAEGLEHFNAKRKIPVYKLPIAESGSGRFAVGNKIGTKHKWVEADKGTNLFFVVYEREDTKTRMFDTVPLNEVIGHQKLQVATSTDKSKRTDVPIKNTLEYKGKDVEVAYLFHLSPNDLVYIPTAEEQGNSLRIDFGNLTKEQRNRIYKFVSCTGGEGHFIPVYNAFEIIKNENGTNSKSERMQNFYDGVCLLDEKDKPIMIKEVCIKLKVDRLGNISKATTSNNSNIVSEPAVAYEKKKWTLKSFDSFEAMERAQLLQFASLRPLDLFRNLKTLTLASFGFKEEKEMQKTDRKIKFE